MDTNATKPPASARRFGGDDPDFEADIDRALGPYGTPVRDQPTGGGPPVGQRPVLGPSRGMRSEGPPVSIKDAQHPDRGGDGADRITRPHQVLEVGAGPVETDLGVPKDPALVQVTQTDLTPPAPTTPALDPPRVVRQFDATGPLPDDLVGAGLGLAHGLRGLPLSAAQDLVVLLAQRRPGRLEPVDLEDLHPPHPTLSHGSGSKDGRLPVDAPHRPQRVTDLAL